MKIDLQIGSKEWLEFRRTKIMASDAPIIMGVSPWCSPRQLYFKKLNGTEQIVTPAMQRGIRLESEAREKFEEMTGHFVWPEIHQHPDYHFMAATFDGINDKGVLVEIKVPNRKDHEDALGGKVPEKYYPQVQHQMHVAGVFSMFYFSYSPEHAFPCALVRVPIDEIYCYDLMQKEREFLMWLEDKIEPPEEKEIVRIEDADFIEKELIYHGLMKTKHNVEMEIERLREELVLKADGRECRGNLLHFKPSMCKGSVDYKKICEEHRIYDVDKYRKPSFQKWTIRAISD